jgi:hypothetical protein
LSFEFAVPEFAEDAIAGHISTAGTPWEQGRYDDPAADITEPAHRAALADRYDAIAPPGPINDVIATVSQVIQSPNAPDGGGVTTTETAVEAVALLRSDPVAAPTFRGVSLFRGVETGAHRLTINAPGLAPYDESLEVGRGGDGTDSNVTASATPAPTATGSDATRTAALAGVDGEVPLVPSADAARLEIDTGAADAELTAIAIDDDFGGRLYETTPDGPDAVYVHRAGAYTVEARDADGAVGVVRVNPTDAEPVRIDAPDTGVAALASFVASIMDEMADRLASVEDDGPDDAVNETDERPEPDDAVNETDERPEPDDAVNETDERPEPDDAVNETDERPEPDDAVNETDGEPAPGSVGETNTLGGLLRAIEAVSAAAERAAERAEAGDRRGADQALQTLSGSLQRAAERFDGLRGTLPAREASAVDRQFRRARRRTNQAIAAEKL